MTDPFGDRDSYGGKVLLVPSSSGFDAPIWARPAGLMIGLVGLWFAFKRWRAEAAALGVPTEGDYDLVEQAVSNIEAHQMTEDRDVSKRARFSVRIARRSRSGTGTGIFQPKITPNCAVVTCREQPEVLRSLDADAAEPQQRIRFGWKAISGVIAVVLVVGGALAFVLANA